MGGSELHIGVGRSGNCMFIECIQSALRPFSLKSVVSYSGAFISLSLGLN